MPTVLITGASSGFGCLLGERLASLGYRVFGTSRTPKASSATVSMVELDVDDDASVGACVRSVTNAAGPIDVLVNNAGRLDEGALEDYSASDLQTVFNTNFFGVARMVNAVLPSMRAAGRGRILNVGSLSGLMPLPFMGAYCASKHALESYTESLRYELQPLGIHVSIVEPGYYRTGLAGRKHRRTEGVAAYDPHRRRMFASFDRDEETAADPVRLVARLVRILESPHPRLRYPIGKYTLNYYLKGITPQGLWERGLRLTFGIDRRDRPRRPISSAPR